MADTYKTAVLTSLDAGSRRLGETNDCTVRALAAAAKVPYDTAHAALAKHGRPYRKGPKAGYTIINGTRHITCRALFQAAKDVGATISIMDRTAYRAKTMTTAPRDPAFQAGSFIAYVRGHVAAIVDGDVCDWTDGRRHRIQEVWQLVPAKHQEPEAQPMQRMTHFTQGRLF